MEYLMLTGCCLASFFLGAWFISSRVHHVIHQKYKEQLITERNGHCVIVEIAPDTRTAQLWIQHGVPPELRETYDTIMRDGERVTADGVRYPR